MMKGKQVEFSEEIITISLNLQGLYESLVKLKRVMFEWK